MIGFPKHPPVHDRKYLDWLRTQPCMICGLHGDEKETVDPMHIGVYGKGMKTDNEALPIMHHYHATGHQSGEISMFRKDAPDRLLRAALRALARELYREWKAAQS